MPNALKIFVDQVRSALPVWAERGFDSDRACFHERLDQGGMPIAVPYRAMVQARQIYVFAHAARLGWFPEGAALADAAMARLIDRYAVTDRGQTAFHFSVDQTGRPVSTAHDAYTHAFVLFALAWLHCLDGDDAHLRLADRVIAFIDARMTDPEHGGLFDALPLTDTSKRQNPLMHLLEAYLFLDEAAPGRGYLERAQSIVDLFHAHLFRAEPGVLLEYFARDWADHADPAKAALFEPGHHFEWVWLLHRFAARAGSAASGAAGTLYDVARGHGIAPSGHIYDEIDLQMQPLKRSHRVWPHTEAIKAAIARHKAGDGDAEEFAGAMAQRLSDTFLDRPFDGGWIDHVDGTGRPLVDYVPASSLYHLFLAATEAATLPIGVAADPLIAA